MTRPSPRAMFRFDRKILSGGSPTEDRTPTHACRDGVSRTRIDGSNFGTVIVFSMNSDRYLSMENTRWGGIPPHSGDSPPRQSRDLSWSDRQTHVCSCAIWDRGPILRYITHRHSEIEGPFFAHNIQRHYLHTGIFLMMGLTWISWRTQPGGIS